MTICKFKIIVYYGAILSQFRLFCNRVRQFFAFFFKKPVK